MANTTFTGPVRSEGGFEVIDKDASIGTVTTSLDIASDGAIDLTYSSADTGTANVEPIVMENTMTGAVKVVLAMSISCRGKCQHNAVRIKKGPEGPLYSRYAPGVPKIPSGSDTPNE